MGQVKVDVKELQALQKRLEKAANAAEKDAFYEAAVRELAARLLTLVKKRTPVISGTLRRGWTVGELKKNGGGYEIEIIDPIEYASYVEFGHRQTPGRYVPAIGKKLKRSWVPGRFMMTISASELEGMAPAILQRKLNAYLKEALDGGQ